MSDIKHFISEMRDTMKYPGPRSLFFPMDAAKRKTGCLRLAREFGGALADFPVADVDREIGACYGQIVVMHCLDSIGVQIDAKTFVQTARAEEAKERLKNQQRHELAAVFYPAGGYTEGDTAFIEPIQHVARSLAPDCRVRMLWDTYDELGYGGDSQIMAIVTTKDGTERVYSLPVDQEDDEHIPGYGDWIFKYLTWIGGDYGTPAFTVSAADAGRAHEDGFNLCYPPRRSRHAPHV